MYAAAYTLGENGWLVFGEGSGEIRQGQKAETLRNSRGQAQARIKSGNRP